MANAFVNLITGIQHIGIPTNDIAETIAFYEKLGFEVAYETVNGTEKVAFLKLGSIVVETYENKQAALVSGALDHLALDVTDVEATYAQAKEAGFEIIDEETGIQFLPFWDNGVRFFKILGPNKEVIEFSQML